MRRNTVYPLVMLLLLLAPALRAQMLVGIPLEGRWKGSLAVPGGLLPVVISITDLSTGGRVCVLDVPAQHIDRASLTLRQSGDTLTFESAELGCRYASVRTPDGQQLLGRWTQPGLELPLTLVLEPLPARKAKAFKFPPPYRVDSVRFAASDGVQLSGTLTTPPGEGPFPAVVLLSDLGAQDRDAAQGDYKLFGALADYLTRHAVAVLRLDDRGVGGSAGRQELVSTVGRVADARVALNFLRSRPLISYERLGLVGHGEGGNVALLATTLPLPPAFVVTLAAIGQPGYAQLAQLPTLALPAAGQPDTVQENLGRWQLQRLQQQSVQLEQLRASGSNAAQIQTYLDRQQAAERKDEKERLVLLAKKRSTLFDVALNTPDDAQAQVILANILRQQDPTLDPATVAAQAAWLVTPWCRSFLGFDPQPQLRNVQVPALLLHGTNDNVSDIANLNLLEKGLKTNKRTLARRLEGVNHNFQSAPNEWPLINGEQKPALSPLVGTTIVDWLHEVYPEPAAQKK